MNCKEAIGFLADYLDRSLPWRQRLTFAWHLAICRDCRAYLDSYRKTVEAARQQGRDSVDEVVEPVPQSVVQAILAARRNGK